LIRGARKYQTSNRLWRNLRKIITLRFGFFFGSPIKISFISL